jgi:hypothetical protein
MSSININNYIRMQLFDNGLSISQMEEVMPRIMTSPLLGYMDDRWDDPVTEFPEPIRNDLIISVYSIVLTYIDETCPRAWFRSVFDLDGSFYK